MKPNIFQISAVLISLGLCAVGVRAQNPSLQDLAINVNGDFDDAALDTSFVSDVAAEGVDLSSLNLSSGIGEITFTDTSTGAGYFGVLFNEQVSVPFYNEYGTAVGAPASGESWEIGDWYASPSPDPYDDSVSGDLDDTNYLSEGSNSNYSGTCADYPSSPVGTCNGDVGVALADSFDVTAGDEEIITVCVSLTVPTASSPCGDTFYIDQTHPIDDNNATASNVYFSLSAEEVPVGAVGVPEGGSTLLYLLLTMLTIGGALFFVPRNEKATVVSFDPARGIAGSRLRPRLQLKGAAAFPVLLVLTALGLATAPRANAQQVLTVQEVPTSPGSPHTAYAGASIVLGAVFTGAVSGHSYTFSWNYGDGSPATSATSITNGEGTPSFNDISSSHVYPTAGSSPGVTSWTSVVTVNDTTTSTQYTGNILVLWENNTLASRVDVAIDWGLWYLHQNMDHPNATAISPGTTGTWRGCEPSYGGYACGNGYASMDANNVLAFEVDGHLPTGPATDPYTLDVQEGLADMLTYLTPTAIGPNEYYYNPALTSFGCADGTAPSTSYSASNGYCDPSTTPVNYNASASSCTSPPCTFTFDGNNNGQYVVTNQFEYAGSPNWGYEQGMFADALVGSQAQTLSAATIPLPTPSGTYASGIGGNPNIGAEDFQDIVQDFVDGAGYCQYGYDYDGTIPAGSWDSGVYNPAGYTRGAGYSAQGGAWLYGCGNSFNNNGGDDNSTSQWTAIGLIVANRGFGLSIPPIITDTNNTWVTDSQNVQSPDYQLNSAYNSDTVDNPGSANTYDYGGFGYRGSLYYSDEWGPWAVTPSGMVQMSLDGIGRTANEQYNNYSSGEYTSTAGDQRFNNAETFYADNFCDSLSDGAYYAPLAYTYGMYSFTKSMLEHNPGGSLSPIQYLRTLTPNVFNSTTPGTPSNTIDWYAAVSTSHYGGTDPCDGIAQTLLNRQNSTGYWYGYDYSGGQYPYETAWSLIMLQKSVFVACVNNLGGAGTASGTSPARIDLTWTGIPSATGYDVLRGTVNGGPYTEVGSTLTTAYSDRTGLTNGDTYYYVLQPTNASGTTICQSNQATITIPKPR